MISYLKSASGFLLRKSTYIDPWSMIIRLIATARGSSCLSTVRLIVRRDGNFAKRNIPTDTERVLSTDRRLFSKGTVQSGIHGSDADGKYHLGCSLFTNERGASPSTRTTSRQLQQQHQETTALRRHVHEGEFPAREHLQNVQRFKRRPWVSSTLRFYYMNSNYFRE